MGETAVSPFGGEPITEVALTRAPLVNVLAQVRFPKAPLFSREEGAAQIQQRLRKDYPILRQASALGLAITPSGVVQQQSQNQLWRLQDRSGTWIVTLSDDFVSIETHAYVSRTDFCDRVDEVLAAVNDVAEPVIYDRVGVRYINQLKGEAEERVQDLVRTEFHGALSVPLPEQADLSLALSEALFRFTDGYQLRTRWGRLPEDTAVDPMVPSIDTRSWILDLDSFTDVSSDFIPADLSKVTRRLADQAYRFFRWVVTPAFDQTFGDAG
jgi:uncharacterized protein (TIGR04255 family)